MPLQYVLNGLKVGEIIRYECAMSLNFTTGKVWYVVVVVVVVLRLGGSRVRNGEQENGGRGSPH